jgi:hypothetical protein
LRDTVARKAGRHTRQYRSSDLFLFQASRSD